MDELTLDGLGALTQQSVPTPVKNPPVLPLSSIDPEAFERLVAELVSLGTNQSVHFYGRRGQKQYGLDIVETLMDGSTVLYQVRRYQSITPKQITDAVHDYAGPPRLTQSGQNDRLFAATKFVLVTAAPVEDDTQKVNAISRLQEAYSGDLMIDAWGQETVSRKLRGSPNLIAAMFGDSWAQEFCGERALREARQGAADRKRAEDALVAAVAAQYEQDDGVQFRQVDLVGISVDSLFVDVPVVTFAESPAATWMARLGPATKGEDGDDLELDSTDLVGHVGAAQVLLHADWKGSAVIVGGPGQGKTTLLQYLCQYHRARLLGKPEAYSPLAAGLTSVSECVRTPIRIELPKYAEWRRRWRQSNHGSRPGSRKPSKAHVTTIERYILELVAERSGMQFAHKALTDVLAARPLLLALDGLDEVADLTEREEIASEIRDTRARLESLGRDTVVLVATRPGRVGRPIWREPEFSPLFLEKLTTPLRILYLERWAKSARLKPDQIDALKETFVASMALGHVAELAGNPMQLAILLHLMQRRAVLPERRTDLYARYIDVFWDRESEHALVATKKDLVLPFHKLLAWHIHSRIELQQSDGTISRSDLKDLLTGYLVPRGQSAEVIDEIFTSVTGRVLCLVARDVDSDEFQFEVQPLREYFAAEHIHDMSPNNSNQNSRQATLSVLIRRPYWSNVMRFFAGEFSPGETPSIVYLLRELRDDPRFGVHPIGKTAAKLLLDDRVFAGQMRQVIEDAAELVVGGTGPTLSTDGLLQGDSSSAQLSPGAGAEQAVEILSRRLAKWNAEDDRTSIVLLLRQLNGVEAASRLLWSSRDGLPPEQWIRSLSDLCQLRPPDSGATRMLEEAGAEVTPSYPLLTTLIESRSRPVVDSLVVHALGEIGEGLFDPPADLDPQDTYARVARSCSALPFYDHLKQSSNRWSATANPGPTTTAPKRRTRSASIAWKEQVRRIEAIHAKDANWAQKDPWKEAFAELATLWSGTPWPLREALPLAPLDVVDTKQSSISIKAGASWLEVLNWRLEAARNCADPGWWQAEAGRVSDDLAAMTYLTYTLQVAGVRVIESTTGSLNQLAESLDRRRLSAVAGSLTRYRAAEPNVRRLVLDDSLRLRKVSPNAHLSTLLWTLASDASLPYLARGAREGLPNFWGAGQALNSIVRVMVAQSKHRLDAALFKGARRDIPPGTLTASAVTKLTMTQAQGILRAPHDWPSDLVRLAVERLDERLAQQTAVASEAAQRDWGVS
ncbi:MAG: hypothetical protein LCH87_11085 [Actinobacteria bacterium]|nr:hypothetical protein [Actinomycetota bacterium]